MDDTRYRIQASWTERRKNLDHITTHAMAIRPQLLPMGTTEDSARRTADALYSHYGEGHPNHQFISDLVVDLLEESVTLNEKGYVDQVGICRMIYSPGVGDIMDPKEGIALARRIAAEYVEGKALPPEVEGLATAGDSTQTF